MAVNPVVKEFLGETAKERKEKQTAIINKVREEQTQKEQEKQNNNRLANTIKGAGKSSASGWVNTAGTVLDLFGLGSKNTSSEGKKSVNAQTAANHYREMLDRGTLDNGKVIDAATRKQLEMLAVKADREAKIYSEANEKIHAPNQQAVQSLQSTADKLSASAQADIAKAKQGLGKGGQFAVDVGVAGTQLLGDALTGGLVATGVRTFGSGAQEARQAGADLGKQIGYGAGSAAVGVATEKIANVAGPFKKAFGSGVLDKALGKVASKPAGKLVVSALSEGGEEFIDALTQPVLQQLTYNPDAAYDADWLAEALYSAAVGSVLGGAGGAIDVATAKPATQTKVEAQVEAKPATVDTQKENAVQSVSEASVKPVTDPLLESITNGKRVEYSKMTTAQLDSMADRKDIGVDAKNRVFQINPEQHIDSRNTDSVSDRNLNAFQFDHPQLHQYYKKAAEALIADAEISQQFGMDQRYERTMQGNKVIRKAQTSQHLGRAMKETGLTRNQIIDAAQRIVNDHGQENVKAAKQIEIILDAMLSDGWSPMMGDDVAPNQDYINAKNEIIGSQTYAEPQHSSTSNSGSGKNTIRVYRGYNRSDNPLEKNLAKPKSIYDFVGGGTANPDSDYELLPLVYYTDVAGDAESYANHDKQLYENLKEQARFDYRGLVINGKAPADVDENTWVERSAANSYNILTGKDVPTAGHVEEYEIAPEKILDLSAIGEYATVDQIYSELEKQTGIPATTLDDELMLGDMAEAAADGDPVPVYFVLKNAKGINVGSRVYNLMNRLGYDALQYKEDGANHYAVDANKSVGAAEHGFDPYSNLQNQSDKFHPEGPNAARPVDMPTQNLEGRNIPKSGSTIYGAQGTTESGVQLLERDIANGKIAFDTITDADSVARAQTTMQELTFEGALERYRNAVNSGVATKDNTTLGQQLLLQAMRDGNETATAELLALYTRNSTNAAQAMQAQSIFRKLSPEGQLVAVQKTVDALNEKYGADAKLDDADVKEFIEAKTEEERKEVEKRMVKKLAERIPKTFKAKYDTLRYLAMLGNPRTHVRNILGNAFFQVPVALKNRAGAVAERVSNLKGTQVEKTKTLFGTNPFSSIAKEARADFANAKDFLSQSSKYNDNQANLSSVEQEADAFSSENVVGRGLNFLSNKNRQWLEDEDTAFKKYIYAQSLADYLRANGVKSLKDADPALLNRARVYAAEEAQRNTFTDRNDFSDAVAKLGGLTKSDSKTIRAAGYVVEGALPFKRTPANIVARAAEYSPVGAVVSAVKAYKDNKSGDAEALAKDLDRLAAGVSGTALLAAGFIAAGAGYVSGGEDEDKAQADFDKLTGKQAYALDLNGRSYTLDWLAPEAIPFFMGVELYNASLENGLSWEEAVDAVKNMTEPMLEMSMLQGLNDLVENATNAKYSGNSVAGSIITSALTNYATQIFPTLGGQLERASEEVRMTTYTDKNNPLPSNLQYTLGKVSQKMPWDYQQIPYIDAWGRTESTGDPMLRAAENLVSPGYISEVGMDHLETELQKLVDQGASSNVVFPDRAEKSIEVDKVTHHLTAEQYVKYAKAKGQNSYKLVNEAVNSTYYKSLGKDGKQDYISKMYGYADYKAKKSLFPQYESDLYTKYEKAEEVGMKPADYYAMRETYDYDHSSSTGQPTQEEAQFYLDTETNLSRDQKEIMWNIINSSWKKNPYS